MLANSVLHFKLFLPWVSNVKLRSVNIKFHPVEKLKRKRNIFYKSNPDFYYLHPILFHLKPNFQIHMPISLILRNNNKNKNKSKNIKYKTNKNDKKKVKKRGK